MINIAPYSPYITDDAGARAAWSFWPTTYGGKVERWLCVGGKDPSEAKVNGLDLRSWVVAGIFGMESIFEQFCIQTVDGGMTDSEALAGHEPILYPVGGCNTIVPLEYRSGRGLARGDFIGSALLYGAQSHNFRLRTEKYLGARAI